MGQDAFRLGFVLLNALRRLNIPAVMETRVRSLKSQLRQAEKNGVRYCVLIGDEEIQKKVFVLKDMHQQDEDLKQSEYTLDALMDRFLELYRTTYLPDELTPDFIAAPEIEKEKAAE
jgi:histidyl-tRNA synthetase